MGAPVAPGERLTTLAVTSASMSGRLVALVSWRATMGGKIVRRGIEESRDEVRLRQDKFVHRRNRAAASPLKALVAMLDVDSRAGSLWSPGCSTSRKPIR
jgi:hypothetical protein